MNTIFHLAIAFAVPMLLTLALTPIVIKLAHMVGAIDHPNARKAHTVAMPRLGGVAVSAAFGISLLLLFYLDNVLAFPSWIEGPPGIMLGVAMIMVVLLGVWDDVRQIRPSQKFLVQLLLASLVYAAGFHVSGITDPLGDGKLNLGAWDYLVTVFWIIGVTNAINLIDGLDGLATGVSGIALLTMFPIALLQNDAGTAVVALILAGAVFGFLRYNFNPARVFLGDSGSLFLGFMLAILSLQSSTKSTTAFAILVPMVALGLPIMDTLLSMARRFLRSFMHHSGGHQQEAKKKGRWGAMFLPDRGHIHHQLLARGFSQRRVVLLLYTVSCCLGIGAFAITIANNAEASIILLVVGIALVVGVRQLRYREIAVLRNGVFLPLFDLRLLNRNVFQVFLDIVFMIFSYGAAHVIHDAVGHANDIQRDLVLTVALVCLVQFIVFWLRGTYRFTMRQFGLAEALALTKTVILAVTLCGIAFALIPTKIEHVDLTTLMLDFYLLLTCTIGSRFSFRVLHHFFRKGRNGTRKVLIYGADREGAFALQRMLDSDAEYFSPAGFMDDRPSMEGRHVNGFQVFGGHWRLERLVRSRGIHELLLSSDDIKPEILRRLLAKAQSLGLTVRRLNVRFDEVLIPKSDGVFAGMPFRMDQEPVNGRIHLRH